MKYEVQLRRTVHEYYVSIVEAPSEEEARSAALKEVREDPDLWCDASAGRAYVCSSKAIQ